MVLSQVSFEFASETHHALIIMVNKVKFALNSHSQYHIKAVYTWHQAYKITEIFT
jgi:hypothetical protein